MPILSFLLITPIEGHLPQRRAAYQVAGAEGDRAANRVGLALHTRANDQLPLADHAGLNQENDNSRADQVRAA